METARRSAEAPPAGSQAPQSGLTTQQRVLAAILLSGAFGAFSAVVLDLKAGIVAAISVFLALVGARNL